jgi:hypothetical protein
MKRMGNSEKKKKKSCTGGEREIVDKDKLQERNKNKTLTRM